MEPTRRPRRLRADGIRPLVRETTLEPADLVAPVFVDATASQRRPIESMPGQERVPPGEAPDRVAEILGTGVETVILFGIPESKDERGTRAWAENGVVQRATRAITDETDATVVTDVCLCEYTDHGHCGVLGESLTVDNDTTLALLERIAVSHAEAGADIVAPSGMMDGMVGAIREALDDAGHTDTAILSYTAKYSSSYYGPFRDALDSAPEDKASAPQTDIPDNKDTYQMDPANGEEAVRELMLDLDEGADMVMVKPALPYLDVIHRVQRHSDVPVAAYNVSGEYAMIKAAAQNGWLDEKDCALEALTGIRRAGADLILTYFAEQAARWLEH